MMCHFSTPYLASVAPFAALNGLHFAVYKGVAWFPMRPFRRTSTFVDRPCFPSIRNGDSRASTSRGLHRRSRRQLACCREEASRSNRGEAPKSVNRVPLGSIQASFCPHMTIFHESQRTSGRRVRIRSRLRSGIHQRSPDGVSRRIRFQ
jgi:hypothetical protein